MASKYLRGSRMDGHGWIKVPNFGTLDKSRKIAYSSGNAPDFREFA